MNKEDLAQSQIEPLLNYFQKIIPLSKEENQVVTELFKPRLYRKRQYVLQEGDVCNFMNFVVRGCLRMYTIDELGNTYNLQFSAENSWICNLGSFYERKPSLLNIDALEDTMVLQIKHEELTSLFDKANKFNRIFRVLIENSYIALQKRLLQNISSTAEERYQSFQEAYPHLTNRLSQIQIASFLGITPEFLSRLRSRQIKKS